MLKYVKFITREMMRKNPKTLYVFGDNMMRRGTGGQAYEMRGEPNAVGIPTKYAPGVQEADYFIPDDFRKAKPEIEKAFELLHAHLAKGKEVVWPEDGIGTGMAQLKKRAPLIWDFIEKHRKELEDLYS